jgi:hypothetical protein
MATAYLLSYTVAAGAKTLPNNKVEGLKITNTQNDRTSGDKK